MDGWMDFSSSVGKAKLRDLQKTGFVTEIGIEKCKNKTHSLLFSSWFILRLFKYAFWNALV
jgi:hypothetical protein